MGPESVREDLARKKQSSVLMFGTQCGFLLIVYLLAGSALAQSRFNAGMTANDPTPHRFDSWTTANGLPQNSVVAITQTRDGYLWFATLDGLVRYDGMRFTVFDRSNTPGFATNRCYALFEDKDGTLWIGTEEGSLMRYRNGVFSTFTTADGLPKGVVDRIQTDSSGHLLVTTWNGTVRWQDGRFVPYLQGDSSKNLKVYVGRSGALWRWDEAGLHRSKDGTLSSYNIPLKPSRPDYIVLYETRNGDFWGKQGTEALFRISNGVITRYAQPHTSSVSIENLWTMLEDRQGNLWFGTYKNGMLRYKDGEFTNYATANGLSSNSIRSLFEDREGTLWIGTYDRGLNRLTKQFISTLSTADGLIGDNVYPIYEDRTGEIWLGTYSGLSRFSAHRFTNYNQKHGLLHTAVQALTSDHTGKIWVGTSGGLYSFAEGKFTAHPELMPVVPVQVIEQDKTNALWVGTERGLLRIQGDNKVLYTTQDGLPADNITVLREDRQGALWIGTYEGLTRLKDGRFTVYTTKEGLHSNRVRSLYEDSDGVLWIGTYDGGLSRLNNGRFTNYTMDQGLFNNGVFQILEDQRGNFWISSNRGVYRVRKRQLNDFAEGKIAGIESIAYGAQDGLLNIECNGGRQPAGIKTRDGKLWFPTQQGVIIIDPEAVPFNPQPPPVLIEGVTIDRANMAFAPGGQGGADVRVLPGQANLEISYTGLSFTKPEQVRFKYKLTGQDADWIEAGTRRTANYSYLRPGAYEFIVLAANSDGVWNNTGARLRVVVVPAFYQTWWFRLLGLLSIAGVIGLVFKQRLNQANRARQAQEAFSRRLIDSQEQERKRIAAELHDGLGQSLAIIKNRALHSLIAPDDHDRALEQIEEIAEAATQAILETRDIAYNLRPFHIDQLGLTAALETMIERAAYDDLHFTTDLDLIDGGLTPEQEINFYRIVQECLNNIIKHAEATQASVIIKQREGMIDLTIEDNGRGFTLDSRRESANGSGFGLLGLTERARILDGSLAITSAPGKGTQIHFKMAGRNRRHRRPEEQRNDP